jgi:hypothetical protein
MACGRGHTGLVPARVELALVNRVYVLHRVVVDDAVHNDVPRLRS